MADGNSLGRRLRRLRRGVGRDSRVPPPITEDLQGWCAARADAEHHVLLPGGPIVRSSRPHTIEPQLDDVFTKYFRTDAPDHVLAGVPRGAIAPEGVVFLPDGSLVGDSVTHMLEFRGAILAQTAAYIQPLPARPREVAGSVYSLVIGNAGNYFHWMQDVMMRLPAAMDVLPPDVRFVVPAPAAPFHAAMLDALGFGDVECVAMERDEMIVADRLYFPSPYLKPMLHTAAFMEPFARLCRAHVGVDTGPHDRRIYITRRREHHWNVVNEDAVTHLLEARGFITYDLGELDFADQIALFSRAEVVVGTGAGLSNLVFAPAGTKVVQLQDPTYPVGHQFTIADAMQHEYWYFFAHAAPSPGSRYGRANLEVPVDRLEECLDAAEV